MLRSRRKGSFPQARIKKWRIKRNFEQGRSWSAKLFGYRLVNGTFIILPDESAIVKRVFEEYLSGKCTEAIANGLNADGLTNRGGNGIRAL